MEKIKVNNDRWPFPDLGGHIEVPLCSVDQREHFFLDISRKRIALTTKYQTRARKTVVLARLDFNSPHRNPDDSEVGAPHLHLYKEGYGDRWAYPISDGLLSKPNDAWQNLLDFMKYCMIVDAPYIDWGLFTWSNLQS